MEQLVIWQQQLHQLLSQHIQGVTQDPAAHGLMLMTLSFAYGVFHAIGPGHGKAVIITYLGTHRESLKRGALISLIAALFQALVAVGIVGSLAIVLKLSFSDINVYGQHVTAASYVLVMILGLYLAISALRQVIRRKRIKPSASIQTLTLSTPGGHAHLNAISPLAPQALTLETPSAVAPASCSCGGHHAAAPHANEPWRQSLAVAFSMGLRPCSGALIVLIYAHLVGAMAYGIGATLMMGLGTGLSVATLAFATQLAKQWFEARFSAQTGKPKNTNFPLGLWFRIGGGLLIFLLGLSLYQAASEIATQHPLL